MIRLKCLGVSVMISLWYSIMAFIELMRLRIERVEFSRRKSKHGLAVTNECHFLVLKQLAFHPFLSFRIFRVTRKDIEDKEQIDT